MSEIMVSPTDSVDQKTDGICGFFLLLHRVNGRCKREAMAVARTREDASSEKKKV
jgi:hypothetical protein